MGSVFSQPKAPTPPPPPPPSTIRDEIGGTEQVPVKNEDGSITYITRRLPLTEEQQKEKETYDRIMNEALAEIEKLSATDFEHDESTKEILNNWQAARADVLESSFDDRETFEEKNLARRGLSESSAARGVRRLRNLDEQKSFEQLERERDSLSNDIRNQKLALQQNLYGIASVKDNVNNALAYQSAAKGLSAQSALDNTNRASISDYYNRQLNAYNTQSQGSGFGSFGSFGSMFGGSSGGSGNSTGQAAGTAIGTAIGGPAGGAIGGAIGSLF